MEREMSERLVVDSVMTADGEVVPLGPVDKDGHSVPLDTTSLYGPCGECYKVKSFVRFPLMDCWFMECALSHDLIDVSVLHLKAPDSWERLLGDLDRGLVEGSSGVCVSACGYAGTIPHDNCDKCRFATGEEMPCNTLMFKDIARRIRALRGEGE